MNSFGYSLRSIRHSPPYLLQLIMWRKRENNCSIHLQLVAGATFGSYNAQRYPSNVWAIYDRLKGDARIWHCHRQYLPVYCYLFHLVIQGARLDDGRRMSALAAYSWIQYVWNMCLRREMWMDVFDGDCMRVTVYAHTATSTSIHISQRKHIHAHSNLQCSRSVMWKMLPVFRRA